MREGTIIDNHSIGTFVPLTIILQKHIFVESCVGGRGHKIIRVKEQPEVGVGGKLENTTHEAWLQL